MRTKINARDVFVNYEYSPAVRGCQTTDSGDPGWPSEPEQVYDVEIVYYSQHFKREFRVIHIPNRILEKLENEILKWRKP